MKSTVPLILASRSPRRRQLLRKMGLTFAVKPSPAAEEAPAGLAPETFVQHLAERKAAPVAEMHPAALTLAADTVVALAGEIIEKPTDADDARRMLHAMSGRAHRVYTGLALHHPASGRKATAVEHTRVQFGRLTEAEIEAYVATGRPLDKAGAYGIQDAFGAVFVESIEGDYYNVMGLPLHCLYSTLREIFGDLLVLD